MLLTDKTGTLTEGAITFDQSLDPTGQPATTPFLLGRLCSEARMTADGLVQPGRADQRDLHLIGFLTFEDRPKADAGNSIAELEHLGIAVKIITGDNGTVAVEVCRDIGRDVDQIVTGLDLEDLSDDDLAAIPHTTVFARVSRDQKSRIIKGARRTGSTLRSSVTVSMTPSPCTPPTSASPSSRPPT